MNKTLIIIFTILVTVFLASCNADAPKIALELDSFEFGDVVNGVIATKDLEVENKGSAPLLIEGVSTSCGCTTAAVEYQTILPGETATLHIEFDSGAHGPDLTGELMRQVFIMSNDPDSPEVMVEFTANVVK